MKLISILRKGLASVTLAALTLSIAPLNLVNAASVSSFTDANQIPSWADEAIEELMDQGVISGNGDGSFAPNRQLNRAEVAKILVLATGVDMDTTGGTAFPDVTAGDWFYDYVMTMYNYGWVNGYPDGYFRPGVGINRAEIAKMVVEAFELDTDTTGGPHFSDVAEDSWMYPYVETAFNNGLMTGFANGQFGGDRAVTRAETARIVYDAQLAVVGPVGPAEGTLEVNLSYDTPRGTNIPYNATSVPFTTLEMTAADDSDVEVSSITVTRLGLGDNDSFDNVWLEIDGFKVGSARAINNDDYAELRFNPPIVVPAGQTLVADIVGSLEGNENNKGVGEMNRLAIVSAADIVSTAINVIGDFPIEGEEMEIADYQVSQIQFDSLGSDTTVNVGDAFVEIGKFKLLNETNTNKDIELRAITFKNDGTAQLADVLENVVLYVSGEQVSAETIIDGDYITFRLDNGVTGGYIIEDGDSRIFSIRADIVTAEDNDVINFKVDNFEDIVGVEVGTAFGVKAVAGSSNTLTFSDTTTTTGTASCAGAAAEDNCARLRAYVIDSGDINISRDPASLGNQEYAPGSNDVVFMTARIVVDQPLTVDGIKVRVASGTSVLATTSPATTADTVAAFEAQFDNFRLYLNDQLVDSKNELTESTSLVGSYFDFDTQFEIAGTSILKLVGNIKDGAETGSKVKFKVAASTDLDSPEYISTGDQVATDQLLGSAESSFVEVQQSTLTITKTDGFSVGTFGDEGETFVAGADDLTVFKFVLDNNDAGDVNVTSITVNAYGTGNAATYSNFQAAIFVDGVQQGSSWNFTGTTLGAATFNDLSVNIPSAGQKEFTLVLDTIESSANSSAVSTTLATGTGVTTVVATAANVADDAGTTAATVNAGSTTISVAGTGTLVALSAGDQIVVSDTGAASDSGAEIRTVASDAAVGSATITVTEVFGNGHNAESVSTVTTQYPIGAGSVTLTNATGLEVGDVIRIAGATGGAVTATDFAVKAISGNVVTLGESNNSTVADTLATAVALGASVTQQNSDSVIQFKVSAIDVDNVENGQSVEVSNLSDADANCDTNLTATSSLCSAVFGLVSTGTLNVNTKLVNPETRLMVAGQKEFTVFQMNLNANNDVVEVSELFFINDLNADGTADALDVAQRVDFKLYDEAGTLIQSKTMATNGKLHFQLPDNQRIIVPEDDSTYLTVKVDVRGITESSHTGKQLRLVLDSVSGDGQFNDLNGIEAFTAATGANIDTQANDPTSATAVTGDTYVAYRTKIEFANATTQPTFQVLGANTTSGNAIFRFTVTADSAYNATVDKMTMLVSESAAALIDETTGTDGTNLDPRLFRYSSAAYTGNPTEVAVTTTGTDTSTVVLALDASEEVSAGTTNYYELRIEDQIVGTAAENDAITVSFTNDTTYQSPYTNVTTGRATALASGNNIIWSDRSNNGGFGPYLNGYELVYPNQATGASE